MTALLLAGPARQVTLAPAAPPLLHVAYTLTAPATTELLLCDLLGRVLAPLLPATAQPAGTYEYLHSASLLGLPADTYLLAFYCNGTCLKTRPYVVEIHQHT
ncbi:hypothetical protein GCM10023185_34060 [Hymenobacter saemangeumensis]|uniref:T9SS type A sorting domain-containing protein n=1 Tax=Hymenobacter saemangeumensis TaxID=1084522 RepID=A0ABP8IP95_9BACT